MRTIENDPNIPGRGGFAVAFLEAIDKSKRKSPEHGRNMERLR